MIMSIATLKTLIILFLLCNVIFLYISSKDKYVCASWYMRFVGFTVIFDFVVAVLLIVLMFV